MVDPLSYFSFQPESMTGATKAVVYAVLSGMVLIGKSSPCGVSWFPLSLSEWSFIICLTPYNRK